MQYMPCHDKTDDILRWIMDMYDEELLKDHCCTISKGLEDIEKTCAL